MDSFSNAIAALVPYLKWGVVLYLVFAVWVVQRINERGRQSDEAKNARLMASGSSIRPAPERSKTGSWFSSLIIFILFTFLSMGALLMPVAIGERISVFFTGEPYIATVTSISSTTERVTRTDSDKRSYSTMVTMYTPQYAFTLDDGRSVEANGDIASQNSPSVGDTQRIFYNPRMNQIVTLSISNILMLSMGLVFSVLLLVVFGAVVVYAFGGNPGGALKVLAKAFFRLVLPLMLLGMALGTGYYLYERVATDRRDGDPVFVAVMAGIFCLFLVIAIWGWIRGMGQGARGEGASAD